MLTKENEEMKGELKTMKNVKNDHSTASLTLGILGLVLFLMPYIAIIMSILAVIFGRDRQNGKARAGLVCGIIGLVINFLMLIMIIYAISLI